MSGDSFPPTPPVTCFSHDPNPSPQQPPLTNPLKRKRNLPGNPDPNAEVIALSPRALMVTNRFVCEICNKGFQRDQNLQLHRRGHNLPWKLRQRTNKEVRKRVYVCPEKSCIHHDPSRALGDLTGIKKHFSRKHGEKNWKCDKCDKKYAVQSDWKAHVKNCGSREFKCHCGLLFFRRESLSAHRAFCDALKEESAMGGFKCDDNDALNNIDFSDSLAEFYTVFGQNYAYEVAPQDVVAVNQQETDLSLRLNHQAAAFDPYLHQSNETPPIDLDFVVASSMGLSEMLQMTTLDYGGGYVVPMSMYTGAKISVSTSSLFGLIEEKSVLVETMASFYSPNLTHQISNPAAHMSATALLQEAAEMGAITSDPSASSFLDGLLSSSFQDLMMSTFSAEEMLVGGANNVGGLMATVMPPGSEQGSSLAPPPGLNPWVEEMGQGLTRDFLGLGEQDKLASMGSALDWISSSYNGSDH